MNPKAQFNALKQLSVLPDEGRSHWLGAAEESVEFLRSNAKSDAIVLYATMPCAWIASAFAPTANLDPIDREELRQARIELDDTWVIQRSYGGGEGHRVYLDPPLSFAAKPLEGGELPVYRRTFYGMERQEPFEINQRLLHALGLFFVEHRSAYCRLDDNGDLEDVISIISEQGEGIFRRFETVTINAEDLAKYLTLSDATLVRRFDFMRVDHATFGGWGDPERSTKGTDDLYYGLGIGDGNGSWANGYQIVRSQVTKEYLVQEFIDETNGDSNKQYETFIAVDWKNQRIIETSCSPDSTANYFTESNKPLEVSPVFFHAEVLSRYKANPEKYRLEDRSITCRNAWHLKTYDINEHGQVHTYLVYLAALPISEQRYWKAFNEAPKGPISKRAYETDFQGEWSSEYDPLYEIKQYTEKLNSAKPLWWSPRDADLIETTHYPVTDSSKEWSDEILALDQLTVEGFVEKELRKIAMAQGYAGKIESGGINALAAALEALGLRNEEATKAVLPLRVLHHLRSKVRGHSSPREKQQLTKAALNDHGSYRAHFRKLAEDCDASMARILAALGFTT